MSSSTVTAIRARPSAASIEAKVKPKSHRHRRAKGCTGLSVTQRCVNENHRTAVPLPTRCATCMCVCVCVKKSVPSLPKRDENIGPFDAHRAGPGSARQQCIVVRRDWIFARWDGPRVLKYVDAHALVVCPLGDESISHLLLHVAGEG